MEFNNATIFFDGIIAIRVLFNNYQEVDFNKSWKAITKLKTALIFSISNSNMQINQQVTEITGTAAQFWGNALIPSRGTITVKITGDTLQATLKSDLEKKESWTRIQNIDSIEILEAPFYALLAIGVSLVLPGLTSLINYSGLGAILLLIGCILIAFALSNKRRYLVIYSHRYTIPVFMTKQPEGYQQFVTNVLMIARKLNSPVSTPTRQAQTQTQ